MKRKKSSSGFTLLEFAVLVFVLASLSAVGLSQAIAPRKVFNERCAVDLLRMMQSSRSAWAQAHGEPPSFWELGKMQESTEAAPFPRGLMPAGFSLYGGVVTRAGFLFQEPAGQDSRKPGCWATPKLVGYSGEKKYWLDYSTGQVYEYIREEFQPNRQPRPADLNLLQAK